MWVSTSTAFLWRMQDCYKPAHCPQEASVPIPESVSWVRYNFHFVRYRPSWHIKPMMHWSCKPDAVEVTIEYGERCIYVDGITRATQCKELFSHLQLLTGSKIPENTQMWANGRVFRRQQTIKDSLTRRCSMQTKFYHPDITPPNSHHLSLSIPYSISFCLGFMQYMSFVFSCC